MLDKFKQAFDDNLVSLSLAFLILSGFLIRAWNLEQLPLWVDEAINGRVGKGLLEHGCLCVEKFGGGLYTYGRSPIHSYLIAGAYTFIENDVFAVRLPGIIFGTIAIPTSYFYGKKLADKKTGLLLATLITFLPWQIATSRYTRFYSQFQTIYLLSLVFFFIWISKTKKLEELKIKSKHNLWLIFYILTLIIGKFTHAFYPLILVTPATYLFYIVIKSKDLGTLYNQKSKKILYTLASISLITIITIISYGHLQEIIQSVIQYRIKDPLWIIKILIDKNPAISTLALLGIASSINKTKNWIYPLIALGSTFILLSYLVPIMKEPQIRYMSPVVPLLLYYTSITLYVFLQSIHRHLPNYKNTAVILIAIAIIFSIANIGTAIKYTGENQDKLPYTDKLGGEMKESSKYIRENGDNNTVYISPLNSPTFHLGWEEDKVHKIRDLTTPKHTDGHRWADKDHAVGNLSEMKKKVRKDNQRGDVWVLIGDSWVNDRREKWVKSNFKQINKTFKGIELYKYRK